VLIAGVLTGTAASFRYGKNLPSKPINIPGLGILQRVQLPGGPYSFESIGVFDVDLPDADDFGRVYVNNYVLISTERPDLLVSYEETKTVSAAQLKRFAVNRGHNRGRRGANYYLRPGLNYIVVELENRTGPCAMGYNFKIGEREVPNVPRTVGSSAEELRALTGGSISPENAICSRRIFEFELE
jgi:hypothetical protein